MTFLKRFLLLYLIFSFKCVYAHPLRLSLCEIDYTPENKSLLIRLKLFLTDVNEALVFDPSNNELAFCQPNESSRANKMLLDYLNTFFYLKIDGLKIPLDIERKKLSGEGENTALWVYFEYNDIQPVHDLEVKNAVFTDLFFDQNNIVYLHYGGESKSVMLNKKTTTYQLKI